MLAKALFALIVSTSSFGGTIQGQVEEPGGAGLAGASVELVEAGDPARARTAYTDGTGRFRFASTPAGAYFLHIGMPGFLTYAEAIAIGLDSNYSRTYTLSVASCLSCEDILPSSADGVLSTSNRKPQTFSICEILNAINFQVPDPQLIIAVGYLRKVGSETYIEGDCAIRPTVDHFSWPSRLLVTQDSKGLFFGAVNVMEAVRHIPPSSGNTHETIEAPVAIYGVLRDRRPLLAMKCSEADGVCFDGYGILRAPAEILYNGDKAMERIPR